MNNWINELKNCYEGNLSKYQEIYKNMEEEFNKFKNKFPIEKIEKISIKEYKTISTSNNESLCYLIENKLKNIYRYLPRPISFDSGYGYKYNAKEDKYYIRTVSGKPMNEISEEKMNLEWNKARIEISRFLKSLEYAKEVNDIIMPDSESIIDIGVYIDLGHIYFPNKIIGNIKYLENMADELGIDKNAINYKYGRNSKIALNFGINKYIRKAGNFEDVNGYILSSAIWDACEKYARKQPTGPEEDNGSGDTQITNEGGIDDKIEETGKNVIIYGVPGSGKSYYIQKLVEKRLEGKDINKYTKRVTFYPEYTYYDFIGQKVPDKESILKFESGTFADIIKAAIISEKNKEQEHYYLIIEEMNRGNAEAIFGDIFQILDRDAKGRSKYEIENRNLVDFINDGLDNKNKIDRIYLPANLSIYATINNADQNVFNMDSAFGRRWEYDFIPCNNKKEKLSSEEKKYYEGYICGTSTKWNLDIRNKINKKILEKRDEIYNAEDKRIGIYYIDEACLSTNKNTGENVEVERQARRKFASKIFRYLYLNVFRNQPELIFKKVENGASILEEYIERFTDVGNIYEILNIGE